MNQENTIEYVFKARNAAAKTIQELQAQILSVGAGTPGAQKLADTLDAVVKSYSKLDATVRRSEATVRRSNEQMADSAGNLKEQLTGVGEALKSQALGGLALLGLKASIESVIAEAMDNERQMRLTEAAVRATGAAAGYSADQLASMSEQLESNSTFAAGTILKAETLLLRYSNIGNKVFPEATQAAMDMAAALDMDLSSAADKVGRALNNPGEGAKMLRKEGAELTASQVKVIEALANTGRSAEAQGIILQALQRSYGGAAAAAAGTFAGAIEQAKNAVNGLIGGNGTGVEGATEAVKDFTAELRKDSTKEAFSLLTAGAVTFTGVLAKLVALLPLTGRGVGEFFAGLTSGDGGFDDMIGKIDQLEKRRDIFLKGLSGRAPQGGERVELANIDAEIERLALKVQSIGLRGGSTIPADSSNSASAAATPVVANIAGRIDTSSLQRAVAAAQAFKTELDAQTKSAQQSLDSALSQNLISYQAYYDAKTQLEENSFAGEMRIKEAQLALVRKESERLQLNEGGDDPVKVNEAVAAKLGEIKQLEAEISAIRMQSSIAAVSNINARRDAEKKLNADISKALADAEKNSANETQAQLDDIQRKYDDLIQRAQASRPDAVPALVKALGLDQAQVMLDAVGRKADIVLRDLQARQVEIQTRVQTGAISSDTGASELRAALAQSAQRLAVVRDELYTQFQDATERGLDTSNIVRSLDAVEQRINELTQTPLQRLALAWSDTTTQMDSAFVSWAERSADALTQFVMTGKGSFKDFANSIIADLVRIQIEKSIAFAIGDGSSSGGGLLGLIASGIGSAVGGSTPTSTAPSSTFNFGTGQGSIAANLYPGRAGGGLVDGPGTPTSDSVLIRASRREYVVQASAVDALGVDVLDAINAGHLPMRYASGGPVGGSARAVDVRAAPNIEIHQSIDARGAEDPAALIRAGERLKAETVQTVSDLMRRGLLG